MKEVINLDTGEILYFDAVTALEAMNKLLYYLGIKDGKTLSIVDKTNSGEHLYFVYNNETWCVRNA